MILRIKEVFTSRVKKIKSKPGRLTDTRVMKSIHGAEPHIQRPLQQTYILPRKSLISAILMFCICQILMLRLKTGGESLRERTWIGTHGLLLSLII